MKEGKLKRARDQTNPGLLSPTIILTLLKAVLAPPMFCFFSAVVVEVVPCGVDVVM